MRFLAPIAILLGAIIGQDSMPAAAHGVADRTFGRVNETAFATIQGRRLLELPLSGLSDLAAPLRLATDAYSAPKAVPPGGAPSVPAAATAPTTTPATTTATTPPATSTTVPATDTGTDGLSGAPAVAPAADGTATAAPVVPAVDVYKPPSVEVAPGGITIYRGSGSP
jgi:hypothetical protein